MIFIPDMSLCLQHADLAQLVDREKQRFDLWPDKMTKLDDAARQAAETLAQLEREHQDQVSVPAISTCCTFPSTKIKSFDIWRLLHDMQAPTQPHRCIDVRRGMRRKLMTQSTQTQMRKTLGLLLHVEHVYHGHVILA